MGRSGPDETCDASCSSWSSRRAPPKWATRGRKCALPRLAASALLALPEEPAIITGVVDSWESFAAWQNRTAFLESFGDSFVTPANLYGAVQAQFGVQRLAKSRVRLQTFIDAPSEDQHCFEHAAADSMGRAAAQEITALAGDWLLPPRRLGFEPNRFLSIGGDGVGLPLHSHGATWLALLVGSKLWYLYPPHELPARAHATLGVATMRAWREKRLLEELPAAERPMACTQRPGELLWLPPAWHHATINVGYTIAVGAQSNLFFNDSLKTVRVHPGVALCQTVLAEGARRLGPARAKSTGFLDAENEHYGKAARAEPFNFKYGTDWVNSLLRTKQPDEADRQLAGYEDRLQEIESQALPLPSEVAYVRAQLSRVRTAVDAVSPSRRVDL